MQWGFFIYAFGGLRRNSTLAPVISLNSEGLPPPTLAEALEAAEAVSEFER